MSAVSFEEKETSNTDEPLANICDYPGADIILLSQDSHHLRVPKVFVIHSSPILNDLVRKALDSPGDKIAEASLPVVELPERGKILSYLLTFVLPVFPAIPPTHEETMELLSVAQKYQMEIVLVHIRGIAARQNPLPAHLKPALRIYALAQKYGLRQEALQSARIIILKSPMTTEHIYDRLDIVPGAFLYELWKYYEVFRAILVSDLTVFRESGAHGTITGLRCTKLTSSQIPCWVDQYILSIGNAPHLFDLLEFNSARTRHVKEVIVNCECGSISNQIIHGFWEALESIVNGSFKKAESGLSLVQEQEEPPVQTNSTLSPPDAFDVPDANLIMRSSDLVNFRVHKPVLAMASEVFKDLLSLPQPSDGELVEGLPVVQVSEDSDLLRSLISMLYPLHRVIPKTYEKVLSLLAACQKYDMDAVQFSIRAEVSQGAFPAPTGAEAFSAYVIASSGGLIPEMEKAALQTLDHPMTFESLGEGLRLFESRALRGLANFRKRYRDSLVAWFKSFLQHKESKFNIWTSCTSYILAHHNYPNSTYSLSKLPMSNTIGLLPFWLAELFQKYLDELQDAFSKPLLNPRRIRGDYLLALRSHIERYNCVSCTKVHTKKGETFCKDIEDRLTHALNEALWDLISDK